MKQVDDEILINLYFYGWELSSDNQAFPDWFGSEIEKAACLLGYNQFDTAVILENSEILKEIKDSVK